jgi:hypothetical protein
MAIRLGRLMASVYSVGLEFSAKTQQLDRVFSRLSSLERELSKLKGTDRASRTARRVLARRLTAPSKRLAD